MFNQPSIWFGVFGGLLLAIVFVDLAITVLRIDASTSLTHRVLILCWRGLLFAKKRGWLCHRGLSYSYPLLLLLILSLWTGAIWVAWSFIFFSQASALLEASTLEPTSFLARFHYVGHALGALEFPQGVTRGGLWKLLTSLCALSGWALLILILAYLSPLCNAAVCKRATALAVSGLGSSPEEMLKGKWNEPSFAIFLATITSQLVEQAAMHRAYPVLHFFHAPRAETSLSLQTCILDEALSLLECGARPENRLPRAVYQPLRQAILELSMTISLPLDSLSVAAPPVRPLAGLSLIDCAVVDPATYTASVMRLAERRLALKALLEENGWSWSSALSLDDPQAGLSELSSGNSRQRASF